MAAEAAREVGIEEDCDLSLVCDGSLCRLLCTGGFAKMWAGGRANVGVFGREGRFIFEVRVVRLLEVSQEAACAAASSKTVHLCRVGWSRRGTPTHALGECDRSWGYGGSARKSHGGKFEAYGESYGLGDVVSCGIDLATGELLFAKNGVRLGCAYTLGDHDMQHPMYPHLLLKNVEVEVGFAQRLSTGMPEFAPIGTAVGSAECTACREPVGRPEVLMLIGLPAAGKTTWAQQHMAAHPDEQFTVLSTNAILEQMKVSGLARQGNYRERFEALMPEASSVLVKLLELAPTRRRKYLWDQTNVYPTARKRKLSRFVGFTKRAVCFVCSPDTLRARTLQRERLDGKLVPEEAVQEMQRNFFLPRADEGFDEVVFEGEFPGAAAAQQVESDRAAAAAWLAAHRKRKADQALDPSGSHSTAHGSARIPIPTTDSLPPNPLYLAGAASACTQPSMPILACSTPPSCSWVAHHQQASARYQQQAPTPYAQQSTAAYGQHNPPPYRLPNLAPYPQPSPTACQQQTAASYQQRSRTTCRPQASSYPHAWRPTPAAYHDQLLAPCGQPVQPQPYGQQRLAPSFQVPHMQHVPPSWPQHPTPAAPHQQPRDVPCTSYYRPSVPY